MPEFYMHDTEIYLSLTDGRIGYSWRVGNFDETKLLTKAVIFWDQDVVKGSRKKMKILIVSNNANQFRHHLNHFYAQVKTLYLDIGPNQIRLHCQKLVFKARFCGDGGPVGVSRGQASLE